MENMVNMVSMIPGPVSLSIDNSQRACASSLSTEGCTPPSEALISELSRTLLWTLGPNF
jgi:hypothetical protein